MALGLWLLSDDCRHHRRIVQVGRPAFYGRVQPRSRCGGDLEVAVDSRRRFDHETEILSSVAQLEAGRIVTRLDIGPLSPYYRAQLRALEHVKQRSPAKPQRLT